MNAVRSFATAGLRAACASVTGVWLACSPAQAQVPISSNPLILNVTAAPNVLMILDNSGSMLWEALPDSFVSLWDFEYSIRTGTGNTSAYMPDYDDANILNVAMRTSQINRVYYNPAVTYRRWTGPEGTQYAASDPTSAKYTPADTSGIDLTAEQSGRFRWVTNTTATTFSFSTANVPRSPSAPCTQFDQDGSNAVDTRNCAKNFWPMTWYAYKGTGSDLERINYYRYQIRGNDADRVDLADGSVTAITTFNWAGGVTRTIAEEKQNFANWFTYSRSRRDAAKNGVSAAFSTLGENYRIGYRPLNGTTGQLDIPLTGGFAGTNRETWFTNMFASSGSGTTPLRVALARAGEYYRTTTGENDPWGPAEPDGLLSCRQSFTILTTDGYYNDTNTGLNNVNDAIGNADGTEGAPYADTYSRTLADVAMYYYKNDLRSDIANRVPTTDADPADWQHMVTFGVALGLQGSLNPDTDLPRLTSGELSWPSTSTDSGKLDDLWHATVNGRGKFVSAATPEEFANGLKGALDTIVQRTASSSNLGVSSTELREGSKVFQARFTSEVWTGDLWAYTVTSGGLGTTPQWKASEQLPAAASRNIYSRNGSLGISFLWDNLSDTQKTQLGDDSTVLDYLRGVRTQEVDQGGPFRNRLSVLGDIVHSSPVFVAAPDNFSYERFTWEGASTYQAFRQSLIADSTAEPPVAARREMVYVSANDGMLHAFDAATGVERFAYVPSAALPAMRTLTSPNYTHRFIVDGFLRAGDVYQSGEGGTGQWRSVLVGTQGRGGRQVFALDITNPDSFGTSSILWEFTDSDLGQFIGNPVLTRLNNGRWAVLIGNGYNSDQNRGFLFVIDAVTGALIRKIDTGDCVASDSPCLSNGLADVTQWDDDGDGTADFAYAGDLRGNVWRFDLTSATASEWKVAFGTTEAPLPLYRALDASGNPQAITSNIEVLLNPADGVRWISFGTGRFLAGTDRADTSTQTWYGLYDNYLGGTLTSPVTGRSNFAQRVVLFETALFTPETTDINPNRVRVISAPGDTSGGAAMTDADGNYVKQGWYLDLLPPSGTQQGERMFYGVQAFSTALFATTAIPADDPCSPGGNGWLLTLDPYTGGRLQDNVFINREPVTVSVEGQPSVNYNVSGVGLLSIPSRPILVRNDAPAGDGSVSGGGSTGGTGGQPLGSPCTTLSGQAGVLIGLANGETVCESLNLPDIFGRLSWRELIND